MECLVLDRDSWVLDLLEVADIGVEDVLTPEWWFKPDALVGQDAVTHVAVPLRPDLVLQEAAGGPGGDQLRDGAVEVQRVAVAALLSVSLLFS